MQKISSYLYPNRIQLLADLASFNVEYTNVYQRIVKIYNGIDNTIEFDIKNADQKRIDLATLSNIELNVMDTSGYELPNSPYIVTPTALKGIATVTIPQEDLANFGNQFFTYSVSAVKDGRDVMLYADSRFGAVGTIELVGNAMPIIRDEQVYTSFTAEIDLKGNPTYHSSAIPATSYTAVPAEQYSFDINVSGFIGSMWLEATKSATISTESFKRATYLQSFTATVDLPKTGIISFADIPVADYKYFRISYSTPLSNGLGAIFDVTNNNNTYNVTVRFGGTGYAVGSQMKILGSVLGGIDGINDLIITVTAIDASSNGFTSSYTRASVTAITTSGIAADGNGTYIASATNITGNVDSITVS